MAFKGSKYEAGKNFGDSFIAQVNKRVKKTWSKFIEDFKVSIKTWEIKILSFEQRPLKYFTMHETKKIRYHTKAH